MFQNRLSGFDMGLGDQQDVRFGQSFPARAAVGTQAAPQVLAPVNMAEIFQAAVNKAIQDYELNRLFNPEYYDYQI